MQSTVRFRVYRRWVRSDQIRPGQKYSMQRGPTRNPHVVTVLAVPAPSGKRGSVQVRIEDGLSKGKVIEAPSVSIDYLPGQEPVRPKKAKRQSLASQDLVAPVGWGPRVGEPVAWTQTLGARMEVVSVDPEGKVARVRGKVLGTSQEFDAPVVELAPFRQRLEYVATAELEGKLKLPEKHRGSAEGSRSRSMPEPVEDDDGLVDRLVFDPKVVQQYKRRFARSAAPVEVEHLLREELRTAKRVRKSRKEYLRLQVPGRFEVPLRKRPVAGDLDSCWVSVLVMAIQPKVRGKRHGTKRRKGRKKAA
jgi:hypothetical protein